MPSKKWVCFNNVFLSAIMSTILSVCLTVGQGQHLSLAGFGYTFAVAFVASLVVAFLVPLPRMGAWYARKMGAQEDTGVFYLIDSAMQVTGFLVILNLVMTIALTGSGYIQGLSFFDRWWILVIQFWAVAYLAFLITRPVAAALAAKCDGNAAQAPQEAEKQAC